MFVIYYILICEAFKKALIFIFLFIKKMGVSMFLFKTPQLVTKKYILFLKFYSFLILKEHIEISYTE